jgi:hypothetical protein
MKNCFTVFLVIIPLCAVAYGAGITPGSFDFSKFDVPDTSQASGSLGVEQISDTGIIVGYRQTVAPGSSGFLRWPTGTVITLKDPSNTGTPPFTQAAGVNTFGTVAGYYIDTANNQYSGFFYQDGKFKTYNIPGLPPTSATTIFGINDFGAFCGYYQAAPAFVTVPYVNYFGHIDTNFPIPGSTFTQPEQVNDLGQVAGTFYDGTSYHGFIRDTHGKITVVDVPGAAFIGTVLIGLNNSGWTSGHFFDSGNHEHGFVRSPKGKFYQIDVPGADTTPGRGTAGGGLNDEGVVVGHYDPPNGGVERGYIARPAENDEEGDDE